MIVLAVLTCHLIYGTILGPLFLAYVNILTNCIASDMGMFGDDWSQRFDIYRKVPRDLTQPTLTGAVISICSIGFIIFLFFSELFLFISADVHNELTVEDPIHHSEKIPVFINISLPGMKCDDLGLDIQDDMGRHEVGFKDSTFKEPLGDNGCRFESHFLINKVPGNFHISTHSARQQPQDLDMSHVVHKVRFGMDLNPGKNVRGSFNPLEGVDKTASDPVATHNYILRVVPTVYEDLRGNVQYPFQYTYSWRQLVQFHHGGLTLPAIWFRYDLSPITVWYKEKRQPLYTFLTTVLNDVKDDTEILAVIDRSGSMTTVFDAQGVQQVCAIVGGTFTVASIVDSLVFTASQIIKKAELGKLS